MNNMKKTLVASLFVVFPLLFLVGFSGLSGVNADFSSWFEPDLSPRPQFTGSEIYSLDGWHNGLNLDIVNGSVQCFGDFNSDQYTDLFLLDKDRMSIYIYLWSHDSYTFEAIDTFRISSGIVTNLVAGDFNYDGKLDLLIYGQDGPAPADTFLSIHIGDYSTLSKTAWYQIQNLTGQVLVMDANADLKLDFFGVYEGVRYFWINQNNGQFTAQEQASSGYPIMEPNSNTFADFDGDCMSDLLVTSWNYVQSGNETFVTNPQIELWINQKGSFKFERRYDLTLGAGQVTVADFDGDGTMDILYPTCYPFPNCTLENSIRILYNDQIPICKYLWDSPNGCRQATSLCVADNNFEFELMNTNTSSTGSVVILGDQLQWPSKHFLVDPLFNTLTLRAGDYNLDGYPDLLIPMIDDKGVSVIELWENVPCTDTLCGVAATAANRRTFIQVTQGTDALTAIPNAYAAAFFDFDENGLLDFIVLSDTAVSSFGSTTSQPSIRTLYNNYFNDAYFLKASSSNGVCNSYCDGVASPSQKPYGVNLPGAVFKYTVSDLSGTVTVNQGVQLTQSGYLALQTPYVMFGLGRTSNYIEQFFMGVSLNQDSWYHMWICIIPNSQVVGFPYPVDTSDYWTLELFVKSSGLTLWIIVAVASCLLVIGGLIVYFRWREKKQDKLEKQQVAHHFNFDAL